MYSPDLIQRIYFEKETGDDSNLLRVMNDLRNHNFDFIFKFGFQDRHISWTCFESKRFYDIIKERDEYIYFYLWDESSDFEVVIPGHTYEDELNKPLSSRTPFFHAVWVIGHYFPGLQSVSERPVKISLERMIRSGDSPISKLNYSFKKLLSQYESLSKPIFAPINYQQHGSTDKPWTKLVDKKK
jgi:hypothetical protein